MKRPNILSMIAVALVAVFVIVAVSRMQSDSSEQVAQQGAVEAPSADSGRVTVVSREEDFQPEVDADGVMAPNYIEYSDASLAQAQERGDTSVLFFAATDWCVTCMMLEDELLEKGAQLPDGVTVFKVDYDNDRENKAQYGVTSQHTMIVLDAQGEEVRRWIGGGFETLVDQLI
ncbi:MAG: thioredoxin domain-containing protein [Patescibacteria group bacterium]